MLKKLIIIVIIVIIGGGIFFSKDKISFYNLKNNDDWYIVNLVNNQIYFGHIVSIDDGVMKLSDVHFLEVYSEPTERSTSTSFALEQTPKQVYKLTKKGNDKISATDHTIFLNKSSVLSWEKLNSDSEIVKQINKDE